MITSDTPETDAALYPMDQVYIVWPEFARKLERERDEAKKDSAQLADRLSGLELRTTEELARLERERDEAREAAMRWEKLALREASKLGEIICGKVIEK